jgi:hypothetical protein
MKRFNHLFFLCLLTACRAGEIKEDPDVNPIDTDTQSQNDDTGSSTDDTGNNVEDGPFTAMTYRLHEDIESLVYVSWNQEMAGAGTVSYSFDDEDWMQSPETKFVAGENEQLLLGIPYGTEFTWKVVVGDESSSDATGETGTLSLSFPVPTVFASEPDLWEPTGNYLMASINSDSGGWTGGNYWKFIADREGRIVWASLTAQNHWTIYMRVSYDGTAILYDDSTYWSDWDDGAASRVYRIKIDGTVEDSWDVPGEHHVFTELSDGSIVWGSAIGNSETLERLNPDGSQETIWSCSAFHWSLGVSSSCQSNSLYWHEATDTFLYSFYTTSTAVEIDHASGETLRQWGQLKESWEFDPEDSLFQWQHGLTYTDEGTLLLSTEVDEGWDYETAAREYIVNDKTETLEEIWNYGLGNGVYASTAGEAHRLPNGNTLHNYGSDGSVREVTTDGELVWGMEFEDNRLMGRSVFLEDLWVFAP